MRRMRAYGDAPKRVVEFYRENHREQTYDAAQAKAAHFATLTERRMGAWEALMELDAISDESDPDTELGQLDHALQTAEAARAAGEPEWFVLTALVHDLGKVLCLFGEPQWAVVGDTFPLGCAFSECVVFAEFFSLNPDAREARYQSPTGIYDAGCGLEAVQMSWGHDEYLARVLEGRLSEEALYVIRYHSFHAGHSGGAYAGLMSEYDRELMPWVRRFQAYDLYSKVADAPPREELLPQYQELVARCLPDTLNW